MTFPPVPGMAMPLKPEMAVLLGQRNVAITVSLLEGGQVVKVLLKCLVVLALDLELGLQLLH